MQKEKKKESLRNYWRGYSPASTLRTAAPVKIGVFPKVTQGLRVNKTTFKLDLWSHQEYKVLFNASALQFNSWQGRKRAKSPQNKPVILTCNGGKPQPNQTSCSAFNGKNEDWLWCVPKPEQKAKSFFRITHRRQLTTLNIGFSSRCIKEMLQNSKVLFPFPDQHKLFLNGPKCIMGRVVVKPIVTRERQWKTKSQHSKMHRKNQVLSRYPFYQV